MQSMQVVIVLLAVASLGGSRQFPKQYVEPKAAREVSSSSFGSSSFTFDEDFYSAYSSSWESRFAQAREEFSPSSSYWYSSYSSSSSSANNTGKPTPTTGTCKCGETTPGRIVGGEEVKPKFSIRWQTGIKYKNGRDYWCGGAIINNLYVLTAAHCFFDAYGNRESDVGLVVGVGDHNMLSTSDDTSATKMMDVHKVIIHENYNPKGEDYDIALVRVSTPLTFSKEVGPVCLPADDSKTYAGEQGTASGWGNLQSDGTQPDVLQEVKLTILDPKCWGMPVTERMLCAGYKQGGKDTCQGDSGGPLVVSENGKFTQVGVVSWGYGCAEPDSPGVYARVSKFLPWIKSNTADATECN